MIWTIIVTAMIWTVAAILFFPFVRKHIEEKKCGSDCSKCDDVGKCHVAMGFIAFLTTPFILPFIILS